MRRNTFLISFLFFVLGAFCQKQHFFVGTYTNKILLCSIDLKNGLLKIEDSFFVQSNPSFLSWNAQKKILYAAHENKQGSVVAYSTNNTYQLKPIDSISSNGAFPCTINFSQKFNLLSVGNYMSGNFGIFVLNTNGTFSQSQKFIQHTGKSQDPQRQESPHLHTTTFSNSDTSIWTIDLGVDKIIRYPFKIKNRTIFIDTIKKETLQSNLGAGPRHLCFNHRKKNLYVINELDGTIDVYKKENKKYVFLQNILSETTNYFGNKGSADIHCSPDEKFLYASNRAVSNDISIFSINLQTGLLTSIGHQSAMGLHPRNFNFTKNGQWLMVANRDSDNIIAMKRNAETGLLTPTLQSIKIEKPVFILFL